MGAEQEAAEQADEATEAEQATMDPVEQPPIQRVANIAPSL